MPFEPSSTYLIVYMTGSQLKFFKLIGADNWNLPYKVEVGKVDNPAKPLEFEKMSHNQDKGLLVTMTEKS